MQFASSPVYRHRVHVRALPDGKNGVFLEGTFELSILDDGDHKRFKGGHNHMVDDSIN
jgi:hypothetical protein